MEKAPDGEGDAAAGGTSEGPEPLTYKTWILRVSIHCGGCQKKVKKVLQSIEGVYKIEIDPKQHRVVVTGNVESETLIKKLTKSGKTAELWPENQSKEGGESKIDQTDGSKTGCDSSGEDQAEEKGGAQPPPAQGGGGGGGKKKKKKKKKKSPNANAGGAPGGVAPGAPPGVMGGPVEQANESSPRQQVFSYPQFYYPTPEYGVSYNSAPQSASIMGRGYYTMPRYSYAYYGADSYLPSDSIIDVNHDDTSCSIS